MSTKSSVWWTSTCHLYTDLADEFGGPHAYLRIDDDLVKQVRICRTKRGLSVTLRLPPEVFPMLRSDLEKTLREHGRPIDWESLARFTRRLQRRKRSRSSSGAPNPQRGTRKKP